jgi:hypothetical protein
MRKSSMVRRWALTCLFSMGSAAAFCVGCTGYESHHSGPEDEFTFALSCGAYLSLVVSIVAFVGLIIVAARSEN